MVDGLIGLIRYAKERHVQGKDRYDNSKISLSHLGH